MRWNEFVEAVESYGVSMGRSRSRRNPQWLKALLDMEPRNIKGRVYTGRQVRRLAAWLLIAALAGRGEPGNQHQRRPAYEQRRQAMRLMAAAREGWIVMAEGRAWWSLVEPVNTLRTMCAVALPVPRWRH